jgi:hypothetical protein
MTHISADAWEYRAESGTVGIADAVGLESSSTDYIETEGSFMRADSSISDEIRDQNHHDDHDNTERATTSRRY